MSESAKEYLDSIKPTSSADDFWDDDDAPEMARPVWVTKAPWAIGRTMERQRKSLELLFGAGLQIINNYGLFIVYTPGKVCDCLHCSSLLRFVLKTTEGMSFSDRFAPTNRMILCPDCGNKRCPRATNHLNGCTNSNLPNQPGAGTICL